MHGKPGTFNSCFKRGNPWPNSATKTHFKKKNRRRLTACGGQVGAPHELFARPPLSPLFHLYTLALLYLIETTVWLTGIRQSHLLGKFLLRPLNSPNLSHGVAVGIILASNERNVGNHAIESVLQTSRISWRSKQATL